MLLTDSELQSHSPRDRASESPDWRLPGLSLLLLALFFYIDQRPGMQEFLATQQYDMSQSLEELAPKESWTPRRLCLPVFALIGGGMLCLPNGRPVNWRSPVVWLVMGYFLLCAGSVVWSVERAYTFRRMIVLTCFLIGCIGLARRFDVRSWATMIALVCLGNLVIGVLDELRIEFFQPWVSGYRFAGTMHPNLQAVNCSLLLFAAIYLFVQHPRYQFVLGALGCVVFAMLVLTRSRTGTAAFVVAVAITCLPLLRARWKWLLLPAVPAIFLAGLFADIVTEQALSDGIQKVVLLGRTEEAGTLTGRLPIWRYLLNDASSRPLVGHGYGAYWTAEKIEEVFRNYGWTVVHSHNAYLEVLMNLGLVGLVVFVLGGLGASIRTVTEYRSSHDSAYLFVLAHVAFAGLQSLADVYVVLPSFFTAATVVGVLSMALTPTTRSVPAGSPTQIVLRPGLVRQGAMP